MTDTLLAPAHTSAMTPRPVVVLGRRQDTDDTVTLWLRAQDRSPLPFEPGQFMMLGLLGVGEVPISVSGEPDVISLLQHTIRDVGGVTRRLADVYPGDVLTVRGPYGTGWGVGEDVGRDLVIVAGGIGLAPLRPAILEALAARRSYRRVVVVYGARSPDELLFPRDLRAWHSRDDVELHLTVDHADAKSGWRGRVGLVTEPLAETRLDPVHTSVLACGPEVMMRHVAADVVARGVPAHRVKLSLERNMRCGIGLCGHCQLRELFVCVDGPVLPYSMLTGLLTTREL